MYFKRIKDLRADHDLPQKRVSEALGISQTKYSALERGVQLWTGELLCRLADFYGTSVDYLLNKTNIKAPYPRSPKR